MKIFSNPKANVKTKFGQYQIAVLGDVIAVSAVGMADKSAIKQYGQDMIDVISSFNCNKWAFLGLLHGSSTLTKDGEIELQKSIEWRALHGMAVGALVIGDTFVQGMVQSQFQRIYQKAGLPLGVFNDEDSALKWLAEQGFSTSVDVGD